VKLVGIISSIILVLITFLSGCITSDVYDATPFDTELEVTTNKENYSLSTEQIIVTITLKNSNRYTLRINESFWLGGTLSLEIQDPNHNISKAYPENRTVSDGKKLLRTKISIEYNLLDLLYFNENSTSYFPFEESGEYWVIVDYVFLDGDKQYASHQFFLNDN